jgi:hypothetical protein
LSTALLVLVLLLALSGPARKPPARRTGGAGGLLFLVVLGVAALAARGGEPPPDACPLPGVDGLTPSTAAAACRLDAAIGGGLTVVSGYRSASDQARACAATALPCAPPGRSLHQRGQALDLPRAQVPAVLAALAADHSIPLCHPFPAADPVHFSLEGAGEC